jgi:hypothetical protein
MRGAAWLVAAALFAGCAALDYDKRVAFEESQKRFTQYVRWGKIAKASEYVVPEIREEFLALTPELTDLRLTDWEVLDMDVDDDLAHATVDVRYTGYRLSQLVERSVDVTQEWTRNPESGQWQVTLEVAKIRAALLSP